MAGGHRACLLHPALSLRAYQPRTAPRDAPDPLGGWRLSEWRRVGPELLSLILGLRFRLRASRAGVQEFLHDGLGLQLSIETRQQCLLEAGRAVEPLEDQRVHELRPAERIHADKTPWRPGGTPRWLGVFVSAQVSLYLIAYRTAERRETVLEGAFAGWRRSVAIRCTGPCTGGCGTCQ